MKKAQAKTDKLQVAYTQALASGDPAAASAAKDAYNKAMLNQTLHNAHYQATVNQLTDKLSDVNQQALNYLNGEMPKVYCKSYNAFSEEHIKGYSFELVDESTIEYLVKNGNKTLLPQKQLNVPKDKLWNTKTINSQVLQGILQGESIPKISARIFPEIDAKSDNGILKKNKEAAVRNARTMVTGAENKGRMDSYIKAQNDGVILKKVWVSHHSERTRDWHEDLSGVEKDINEPFENDYGEIMYPGDPTAHPANVYNCRCSIKTKIIGFKPLGKPALYFPAKTPGKYAAIYNGVSVTAQYYSMLNENKAVGNEFWKALNAEGKPSAVWKEYLAGDTSQVVTDKLDNILAKYKGTGQPIKPGKAKPVAPVVQKPKPDLGMYQDKSMTATYYSVKAEDKTLGKEFWDVIQSSPTPSMTWNQYLAGIAPQDITDKLDAILLQHKGTGAWSKPVGAKAAAKKAAKTAAKTTNTTAAAAPDPDDITKAKAKVSAAEANLQSLGNKTYTGIWQENVTLADYEAKAAAIQAKKDYYYTEIEKWDHKHDNGEISDLFYNSKVKYCEQHIDDLVEFETKGKLYMQYSKEYDAALTEYKALAPVSDRFGPEAYSKARKDAAAWARDGWEGASKNSEYLTLDKYYTKTAKEVHKTRTSIETQGYEHYTWGSGPFNSPLAGFENGFNTSGYGYKGPGMVDIDVGGYGSKIRGLTSLIEKSVYDQDVWIQSGQYEATLEAFLKLPYDTIGHMKDAELKQFIGTEGIIPQFISGSINKGGGTYVPGDTLFNIYTPSGSELLYVLEDGHFGKHEHEAILQRGGTYKLTNIYRGKDHKGREKLIVDLELHPENGYDKFQQ